LQATLTPRARLTEILIRSLVVGLFAAAALFLPGSMEDAGTAELVPDLVALLFVQLLPVIFSTRRDLFSPPVYTGIVGAFATVSIAAFLADYGPSVIVLRRDDPEAQIQLVRLTLWVMGLGVIAYQMGYFAGSRPGLARRLPRVAGLVWDRGRLMIVIIAVFIAAAIAYAAFQLRLGVPLTELTRLREARETIAENASQTWIIRGMQLGFLPGLLLLAHAVRKGERLRNLVIALALTGVVVLLVFRLSSRGLVAQVLICCAVVFHYLRRRIPVAAFVALYLVGISVANVAWEWRNPGGDPDSRITSESILANPIHTLARHESERRRIDAVASIVYYFPEREDYLYGESWLAFLVVPIPRWLWPEKREWTRWADNAIPFEIIGLQAPAPLPAVLYANFSWIGILVGMFLFGIFHRGLYDWLLQAPDDPNVVLLYSTTLLYFGPSLMGISTTLQYVLPLWLVVRFIGRRPEEAPSVPRPPPRLGATLETS